MQRKIKLKPYDVTTVITKNITVMAKDVVSAKELAEEQINIIAMEESSVTTVTKVDE